MRKHIVTAVAILLAAGLQAAAQKKDTLTLPPDMAVQDTIPAGMSNRQAAADTVLSVIPGLKETGGVAFPEMRYSEEEIREYYTKRWNSIMQASLLPQFSYRPEIKVPYTVVYDFGGFGGGIYGTMPIDGGLHWALGRRDIDMINLYRYSSAYMGVGVDIAPWLEINGGIIGGISMVKDFKPVQQFGGRISIVFRPSASTSMMLWGEYVNDNGMAPPSFNPVAIPHFSVGASAKFRVGDTTIGIGASVSTN